MDSSKVKAQQRWNVISEGRLYPGVQIAKIKPGLCSSLEINEARALEIIEGQRQQIASFTSEAEAENTILKLQVLGLVVSLEVDDGRGGAKRSRLQIQQQGKRRKRLAFWFLPPLTLLIFALAYFYQLVPQVSPAASNAMAKAQADNLSHAASLDVLSLTELTTLLKRKDFSQLHARLSIMQRNFAGDAQWEYPLMQTLESFSGANGMTEADFNAWVKAHNSGLSFLARAYYYLNQAQANPVSNQSYFDLAYKDLQQAKQLDSSWLPIYSGLIALSAYRDDIDGAAILRQAVNIFPTAYSPWQQYALLELPSWHANFWGRPDFLNELDTQLRFNRRLSVIYAYRIADYAFWAKEGGHIGLCLRFYNKAFESGYQPQWLINRAHCALEAGQIAPAIEDIKRARALLPYANLEQMLTRANRLLSKTE